MEKHYIPDGNYDGGYSHCEWSNSGRKHERSVIESVLRLSKGSVEPKAAACVWIYDRILTRLPITGNSYLHQSQVGRN